MTCLNDRQASACMSSANQQSPTSTLIGDTLLARRPEWRLCCKQIKPVAGQRLRLKGSSPALRTPMYPYVALRRPTYRENSHANHTWHPPSQKPLVSSLGAAARVGSIPIARSTFRCLACPCVVLGREPVKRRRVVASNALPSGRFREICSGGDSTVRMRRWLLSRRCEITAGEDTCTAFPPWNPKSRGLLPVG
jgi:hypothetical protein